jgi:hypothetical protein
LPQIKDNNNFPVTIEYAFEDSHQGELPPFIYLVDGKPIANPNQRDLDKNSGIYKMKVYLINYHSLPKEYNMNITIRPLPTQVGNI